MAAITSHSGVSLYTYPVRDVVRGIFQEHLLRADVRMVSLSALVSGGRRADGLASLGSVFGV